MSEGKVYIETLRRVFDETSIRNSAYIEVGFDGDGFDYVEIRTPTEKCKEYFGPLSLTLSPTMARKLAAALLAQADDCEKGA